MICPRCGTARKTNDELANQSIVLKNKKGSSYFITYNAVQTAGVSDD